MLTLRKLDGSTVSVPSGTAVGAMGALAGFKPSLRAPGFAILQGTRRLRSTDVEEEGHELTMIKLSSPCPRVYLVGDGLAYAVAASGQRVSDEGLHRRALGALPACTEKHPWSALGTGLMMKIFRAVARWLAENEESDYADERGYSYFSVRLNESPSYCPSVCVYRTPQGTSISYNPPGMCQEPKPFEANNVPSAVATWWHNLTSPKITLHFRLATRIGDVELVIKKAPKPSRRTAPQR